MEKKQEPKIDQYRLEKLKEHLLDCEKFAGVPLRKTPRRRLFNYTVTCPIGMFIPRRHSNGFPLVNYSVEHVKYGREHEYRIAHIYTKEDAQWWLLLSLKEQLLYIKEIKKWLHTRKDRLG